jgi:hypothetical protein
MAYRSSEALLPHHRLRVMKVGGATVTSSGDGTAIPAVGMEATAIELESDPGPDSDPESPGILSPFGSVIPSPAQYALANLFHSPNPVFASQYFPAPLGDFQLPSLGGSQILLSRTSILKPDSRPHCWSLRPVRSRKAGADCQRLCTLRRRCSMAVGTVCLPNKSAAVDPQLPHRSQTNKGLSEKLNISPLGLVILTLLVSPVRSTSNSTFSEEAPITYSLPHHFSIPPLALIRPPSIAGISLPSLGP